jgi:hypothetical protein
MTEVSRIIVNIISLAINIGLVYFGFRLLSIFRGGKIGKPWAYISSGVLALAISSSLFSLYYLLALREAMIHSVGGLIMMTGGVLILIGMYLEYKTWTRAA